jgi:hypothetical protein
VASAELKLGNGVTVTIKGTPAEVAALVEQITGTSSPREKAAPAKRRAAAGRTSSASRRPATTGPADYIRGLINEGFFRSKRGLGDVKKKLEEGAHIYPVTTLSPALFRLVRRRELRRIKEGGQWMYVNP